MTGTHGIGHTRMATESAVTTLGAHPFSTGADQCLVHNGSLSNHNNVRRELIREGMTFETENDTEVAAAYLTVADGAGQESRRGAGRQRSTTSTASSPSSSAPRTASAWCAIRSPASRPCMAETDQYVAFGSEYRALANLPGIDNARVWEPEPATVYFWEH